MDLLLGLGLLAFVYGAAVMVFAYKKPKKIWNTWKVKKIVKVLGEKGAVIFFYIWGIAFFCLGLWLMIK
jgi:hypothetical protein